MKFKTRFSHRVPSEGIVFTEPSLTIQSEFQSTTIDYYLKRYSATGLLGDPNRLVQAQYGNFAELQDFQASQNLVARVKENFDSLPSNLRAEFGHNVNAYVEFLLDPANRDRAVELGLMQAEKDVETESQVEMPSIDKIPVATDETSSVEQVEIPSAQTLS